MALDGTKLDKIRAAWAAGDKLGALKIAAQFTDASPETSAFRKGWAAHVHPAF